jgi:hypothetical protein
MPIADMPQFPADDITTTTKQSVEQQKNIKVTAPELIYGTIGACIVSPTLGRMQHNDDYSPFSDGLDIHPRESGGQIFPEARFDGNLQADIEAAKVQILKQPKHGKILTRDGFRFKYLPQDGYTGNDEAIVLVNIGGKRVKVVYFIKVLDVSTQTKSDYENYERVYRKHCKKGEWRISYEVRETGSLANNSTQHGPNSTRSAPIVSFGDLSGSGIRQTTGQWQNATIGIPPTAARDGLLIAPTPTDNADFLPTRKPPEWIAKHDVQVDICLFVETRPMVGWAINNLVPLGAVGDYLGGRSKVDLSGPTEIRLIEQPSHGEVTFYAEPRGGGYYYSAADPDFRGREQVVFEVKAVGKRFKVIYTLYVVGSVDHIPANTKRLCQKEGIGYRASPTSKAGHARTQLSGGRWSFGSLAINSEIEASSTALRDVTVDFGEIPSGTPGVNSAKDARMALSPTAAGYGWFIDPTPADNGELLLIGRPFEWIAKPDSEAEGRTGLRSVLLHEYGHAAGPDQPVSAQRQTAEGLPNAYTATRHRIQHTTLPGETIVLVMNIPITPPQETPVKIAQEHENKTS